MSPLSERDHSHTTFSGVDIGISGPIEDAGFLECVFEKCSFAGVDLVRCSFADCRFASCDLSGMTVRDSKFMNVALAETKAIGIHWTTASPFNLSIGFDGCTVDYSVFFGLKIARFRLERSRAREADFQEAVLEGAVFDDSDLLGSRFLHTDLRQASFRRAVHYAIHPGHNKLGDTVFSYPEVLTLLKPMGILIDSFAEATPGE